MNQKQIERIDRLFETGRLNENEYKALIEEHDPETDEYLFEKARIRQNENFGKDIYLRGLIEFSNYCRCDCYYCGLRKSNPSCERYHLTEDEILETAGIGYRLGFRTFVLQGGEDLSYTDEDICRIVAHIKADMPDAAITLSIGEKSKESYQKYYDAGADRYLLRHETASASLYAKLHPAEQKMENRMRCLQDLKEIGYQIGAGMMMGAPGQTTEDLVQDLLYLQKLQPHMIGIGPFIPHAKTPFKDEKPGTLEETLFMLGVLRLMFPSAMLPSTTALGTIDPMGREKGVLAGGNVIMPNLSPEDVRKKYLLYDGKTGVNDNAVMSALSLSDHIEAIGYHVKHGRGDAPGVSVHQPVLIYDRETGTLRQR